MELVQPDTIKKGAKNPKNRGKTLNYFPNLASNQKASESSKMQKKINLAREVWHECQAGI